MNKLYRISLLTNICFLALLIFSSSVYALFDSNVKKAKEFMQAGMYPQAIALLGKEITDEPTNEEAHFQLGICYINQYNYSSADDRFASAVKLKPDYGYKIGKEFKIAADEALKKGNLSDASSLFDKAIIYDPHYKKQGYAFFMSLGDRTKSVQYYERALQYSNNDKDKKKRVGLKFLKLAAHQWPGAECESLKRKAIGFVSQDIIDNVFPSPYMKTTFEKKYTCSDSFNKTDCSIYTIQFGVDDIRDGDELEIIAEMINGHDFTGEEISILRCIKCQNQWDTTDKGYFHTTIESVKEKEGKYLTVSSGGRKDVDITVRVKRKTIPGPNLDILSSYLTE